MHCLFSLLSEYSRGKITLPLFSKADLILCGMRRDVLSCHVHGGVSVYI